MRAKAGTLFARQVHGHVAVWVTLVIAAVGVIVGIITWRFIRASTFWKNAEDYVYQVFLMSPEEREARKRVMESVSRHSLWAQQELDLRIHLYLNAVELLFQRAKTRIPMFAEEACNTWYYLTSSNDEFRRFVEQKFREIVLSEELIVEQIREIQQRFDQDLWNLDKEMLVRMQADLADEPWFQSCTFLVPSLEHSLRKPSDIVVEQMPSIVAMRVAGFVASFAAGEVLTLVVTRTATTGAIRAASVGSGWATFGVGLIVGFAIDAVVSEMIERHIQQQLYQEIAPHLDAICYELINGGEHWPGLRAQLRYAAASHFREREKVILEHLNEAIREQFALARASGQPLARH